MTITDDKGSVTTSGVRPSRFEEGQAMLLAGLREHYTFENRECIPALWTRFSPRMDAAAARVGETTYGVIMGTPDRRGFDYLAGVEVSGSSQLPADFVTVDVPAQRYAVFAHPGHISTLCETVDAAFHQWLPTSGQKLTGSPDFFERYGRDFSPETGTGDIELWVPIKGGE